MSSLEIYQEQILQVWYNLPYTWDIQSLKISVPFILYYGEGGMKVIELTFKKVMIAGVVIGWEHPDTKEFYYDPFRAT